MSIKSDVLKELEKSPKTSKQLTSIIKKDEKRIRRALKSLKSEGLLISRSGIYSMKSSIGGIPATLVKLGANFGFAQADDGSGDIFIPGHRLKGAMPGDGLLVSVSGHPRVEGSREGEVCAVTRRADRVVGTVQYNDGRLVLVSERAPHTPLLIKKNADSGIKPGEFAAGQIIERGNNHFEH